MLKLVFFIVWAFLNGGLFIIGIAYAISGFQVLGTAVAVLAIAMAALPPVVWYAAIQNRRGETHNYDRATELRLRVQRDLDRTKRRITAIHGLTKELYHIKEGDT